MNRKRWYGFGIVVLICVQLFYFTWKYQEEIERKDQIESNIQEYENELHQMSTLTDVSEVQESLQKIMWQLQASKEKLPEGNGLGMESIQILQIIGLYPFKQVMIENIEHTNGLPEDEEIIETTYDISYLGEYKESKKFIEQLQGSNQVIKINKIVLKNQESKSIFLENKPIETTLQISTFSKKAKE